MQLGKNGNSLLMLILKINETCSKCFKAFKQQKTIEKFCYYI